MRTVKAVTHRHPAFLKEAYKLDGIVHLIDDERFISLGDRFITFDPQSLSFVVCIKASSQSVKVRKFNNLCSAVNCANRV
jgi:hypothetical protein